MTVRHPPAAADDIIPVLIVGAGPAGLATAACLGERGIAYRILERGDRLGFSWANAYDSLRLHTGRHMSSLPGMSYPKGTPLFPSRSEFWSYLDDYARRRGIAVETGREVTSITRSDNLWLAESAGERIRARCLVMATGIMANPRPLEIPGRERFGGQVLHSVEYRRPTGLAGKRIVIVGVGNSGGEIGSELADAGANVTIAVRSGANVVPRQIAGIPIQYIAFWLRKLPRPIRDPLASVVQNLQERKHGPPVLPRPSYSALDAIPLIGFHLVDAIRAGRITPKIAGVESFTSHGVRFSDGSESPFDIVILATGFAPANGALGPLVRRDDKGFVRRTGRVQSADQDRLFIIGQGPMSCLANISRDAVEAARAIARLRPAQSAGGR